MSEKMHALLAPSSAARWMRCPGSISLSETSKLKQSDSAASIRGNCAHAVLENAILSIQSHTSNPNKSNEFLQKLKYDAGFQNSTLKLGYTDKALSEIAENVFDAAQSIYNIWQDTGGKIYPENYYSLNFAGVRGLDGGTADVVIVSSDSQGPVLKVIDYKSGFRNVNAKHNPQLMLYAIGVLKHFAAMLKELQNETDKTSIRVSLVIVQPLQKSAPVKTWETTDSDLWQWFSSELLPVARDAADGVGALVPGQIQCQYCPCINVCPAVQRFHSWQAKAQLSKLTPVEKIKVIEMAPVMSQFAKSVEQSVMDDILNAKPGYQDYKVVRSTTKRKISSAGLDELDSILGKHWFTDGEYKRPATAQYSVNKAKKMLSEKWTPKDIDVWLQDNTETPEGNLVLASKSDRRQSVESGAITKKVFSDA